MAEVKELLKKLIGKLNKTSQIDDEKVKRMLKNYETGKKTKVAR